MEPLYNIYFAGEVLEGQDVATVRAGLARLFKADEATLDKLFSGKTQVLKRDCDKSTALKYKQAMENAGARPVIRASEPGAESAAAPERELSSAERIAALAASPDAGTYADGPGENASDQQAGQAPAEGEFGLEDAGADVLKPEERAEPIVTDVDTSGLDIDPDAQRLSEVPPPPPPSPDTSHLSMGEVGEDIPVLDTGVVPLDPNTDALQLSPEGTDFSDCAPPDPEPPSVDLSGMDLAPAGSDVLKEEYRKKDAPVAPETDHISLKD